MPYSPKNCGLTLVAFSAAMLWSSSGSLALSSTHSGHLEQSDDGAPGRRDSWTTLHVDAARAV